MTAEKELSSTISYVSYCNTVKIRKFLFINVFTKPFSLFRPNIRTSH